MLNDNRIVNKKCYQMLTKVYKVLFLKNAILAYINFLIFIQTLHSHSLGHKSEVLLDYFFFIAMNSKNFFQSRFLKVKVN